MPNTKISKRRNRRQRRNQKSKTLIESADKDFRKKTNANQILGLASFSERMRALGIDLCISLIFAFIVYGIGWLIFLGHLHSYLGPLGYYFIDGLVYFVGFWTWLEATPGMLVVHIKILSSQKKKMKIGKLSLRYLFAYVSLLFFGLGFFMSFWTEQRQTLHDKVSGTVLVKTTPRNLREILGGKGKP